MNGGTIENVFCQQQGWTSFSEELIDDAKVASHDCVVESCATFRVSSRDVSALLILKERELKLDGEGENIYCLVEKSDKGNNILSIITIMSHARVNKLINTLREKLNY